MKRAWLLVLVAVAGCGGKSAATHSSAHTRPAPAPPVQLARTLRLVSPAFKPFHSIPRRYTCDGRDVPIPLQFSGAPKGTRELVLVMRDPDAPTPDFVHWAVAGIPPTATTVPANAIQGRNSFGGLGYRGPCPPSGAKPHHYVISLSAMAGPSGLSSGFSADQAPKSAQLAIATLDGTYSRH